MATSVATSPRRGVTPAICACVVLVVGLVAAVNLAVPKLAASTLDPSASAVVWIVDGYVLFFACLVIAGGAIGDRFGRKGTLLAGLVVLAAGALVSAVAPDVPMMIVGRAVSGVGAAAVLPNTLAVLVHATPPARRGPTVALWASMTGIGGVAGNVAGGAVLSLGSWRWLFGLAVGAALVLAAVVARVAPVSPRHDRRIDPLGAALLTLASVSLLVGIIEGPQAGWASGVVVSAFCGAAVVFVVWVRVELSLEHPLVDPRLFAVPTLRNACLGMTGIFFGMFGLYYVNASLLQYGRGFGVFEAGLGIVPITVPIIAGTPHVGRLVARIGRTSTIALAFAVTGAGLVGLSTVRTGQPYVVYGAWLGLTGVGVMLSLPTLSAAITGALPSAQVGVAGGLQALTREFGSALGVAVVGTLLTSRFVSNLPQGLKGRHTVADALGAAAPAPAHRGQVISAFVGAADAGLRVVGIVVLVVGAIIWATSVRSARIAQPGTPRSVDQRPTRTQ